MEQDATVERFLKLGYSRQDIVRVLKSLRPDAQTNDILEELIKTCHTQSATRSSSLPGSPRLVSRGCSPVPALRPEPEPASAFRPVVIDGSNVAMSHGDKKVFSCQGLQLAVSWFWDKGIRDITVFVPLWRKEPGRTETPISDQHILHELEQRKILVYTPSRSVNGKRVVCYDDRYIIKLAYDSDGIIVSNDNYRDLQNENPQWKKFIEERLLMYTFASDKFMPPDDPLGRNGPTIDDFLRKKPWASENKLHHCPYGKKCTYGVKCKFYHPERTSQSQLSVADELRDRARTISPKHSLQDLQWGCAYQREQPPPFSADAPPLPCPSPDVDEAFSSLESSMSQLCVQNGLYRSYSSGVASYDYSQSGPYSAGYYSGQQSRVPRLQQPAWGSCPALQAHSSDRSTFHYQPQDGPHRQSHSLPRGPWAQQVHAPGHGLSSGAQSPSCDQRRALRSQLSTLFPQSTVDHLMSAHPQVSEMSQLIPLMQSYRAGHTGF